MTFSLVIATYNRPTQVLNLVKQVLKCDPAPDEVIVVDSSDNVHQALQYMEGVRYIRSSHKNQPYQRKLGSIAANSDIVVFLDDDLMILHKDIFRQLLKPFQNLEVVGSAVAFQYENGLNIGLKRQSNMKGKITKCLLYLTGVPCPEEGRAARLGVVGKKSTRPSFTETFNGANMAYYHSVIEKIIPADLLSMAEQKLCMGEDKVISMLASQYGKLYFLPKVCLLHPPNESTYFQNIRTFTAKVIYSRLYLSRIYAQVFNKPWWKEVVIYYWFTGWRLLIALFSFLIKPTKARKEKVLGTLDGLWLALTLPQEAERLTPGINWEEEIQKDLQRAGISISTKHNE